MQIGERIRCLRISKGLTQYDLAQAIHISSSFMNRIEKGSSTVSIEYVCSIANALEVTPTGHSLRYFRRTRNSFYF
ncbi:MAG: helix-turn-helix domain-containing protein [Faecalimonas sp.]